MVTFLQIVNQIQVLCLIMVTVAIMVEIEKMHSQSLPISISRILMRENLIVEISVNSDTFLSVFYQGLSRHKLASINLELSIIRQGLV